MPRSRAPEVTGKVTARAQPVQDYALFKTTHRFFKNVKWTDDSFTFSVSQRAGEQRRALQRVDSWRMTRPMFSSFTQDRIFHEPDQPRMKPVAPKPLIHPMNFPKSAPFLEEFVRTHRIHSARSNRLSARPPTTATPHKPKQPQSVRRRPKKRPASVPSPSSSSSSSSAGKPVEGSSNNGIYRKELPSTRIPPEGRFPLRSYRVYSAPARSRSIARECRTASASSWAAAPLSSSIRVPPSRVGVSVLDFGKIYLN